jgi:hypothetical protein
LIRLSQIDCDRHLRTLQSRCAQIEDGGGYPFIFESVGQRWRLPPCFRAIDAVRYRMTQQR